MFNPLKWFSSPARDPTTGLTATQEKMYALEENDNFRWAAKAFALRSKYNLTSSDLASTSLTTSLASIGQFAELAHGSLQLPFVWSNMDKLTQEGFPLHGYDTLKGSELVDSFRGNVANLQGYVAYRPQTKQLIVTFSGTSSLEQALQDMSAFFTPHPNHRGASLHYGFWNMYTGVKTAALGALRKGMETYASTSGPGVEEIVICGHSMGGVMCYLLAIDLLSSNFPLSSLLPSPPAETSSKPFMKLQLAVFGCPRIGNEALVAYWQDLVSKAPSLHKDLDLTIEEHSVRAYNDGATSLPPYFLGFRHLSAHPLYSSHDALFNVPPQEAECSHFEVDLPSTSPSNSSKPNGAPVSEQPIPPSKTPQFPYGGHNYYNARDMEKLIRTMGWLELEKYGEDGWEERYLKRRDEKVSA